MSSFHNAEITNSDELQADVRARPSLKKEYRSRVPDLSEASRVSQDRVTEFPSVGSEGLTVRRGAGNSSEGKN